MPRNKPNPWAGVFQDVQQRKNAKRQRGNTVARKLLELNMMTGSSMLCLLDTNQPLAEGQTAADNMMMICDSPPEQVVERLLDHWIPAMFQIVMSSPRTQAETTKMLERMKTGVVRRVTEAHKTMNNTAECGVDSPIAESACVTDEVSRIVHEMAQTLGRVFPYAGTRLRRAAHEYSTKVGGGSKRALPSALRNVVNYVYPGVAYDVFYDDNNGVLTPLSVGTAVVVEDDGRVTYPKSRDSAQPPVKTERDDRPRCHIKTEPSW